MEMIEIVLKETAGPTVTVAEGATYYAEFHRALEPFQVPQEEWETILERTGLFEVRV